MTRRLMDKPIDYEMARGATAAELSANATALCKRGYLPFGGVSASIALGTVKGEHYHQCTYAQAMVLYATEEED